MRIPAVVFTKGGGLWMDQIANIGVDAVDLDWPVDLASTRWSAQVRVALQLGPSHPFRQPDQIRAEVERTLSAYGKPTGGSGNVFNSATEFHNLPRQSRTR